MSQPCQESQSRLSFQTFFFEMSLNRSVPAERLKSRGLLFPFGSPPPPRFATFGLGLALAGGCSRGAPLLTPGSGRGRPWCLAKASFLALGGSGFRSRGPQATTGKKKGLCGFGDQFERPQASPPTPPTRSYAAFFCGVSVLLRWEAQRALPGPLARSLGGQGGSGSAPGSRERQAQGSCRRREDARALGAGSNFYPRPAHERINRNPDINF